MAIGFRQFGCSPKCLFRAEIGCPRRILPFQGDAERAQAICLAERH